MKLSVALIPLIAAEVDVGEKKKKPVWTPDNLSAEVRPTFDMLMPWMKELQQKFLNDIESYGKKDYTVNAAGVERWIMKMGKAFQDKTSKCGTGYYSESEQQMPQVSNRRRRSEESEEEKALKKKDKGKGGKKKNCTGKGKNKVCTDATEAPATEAPATEAPATEAPATEAPTEPAGPNALCESFEASMQKIIDWTDKYMAACEYTINKKKAKGQKGTVKDGAKFTKKWKKVVGAFHHGAVNQPNGPLCEKEGYVPFDN